MTLTYRLDLFDEDGSNPRARWSREGSSAPVERQLSREEVAKLVGDLDADYSSSHPDLATVGNRLYRWLDGPTERWLQSARAAEQPISLYLSGGERLRGLPWETLFDEGFLSVAGACPVSPIRVASERQSTPHSPANRPLRVLFMASAPMGVQPELAFEAEEAEILQAGLGQVHVVVEESGSIGGLASVVQAEPEPFDVIHLSGHGVMTADGPRFVMEDEVGARHDASAEEITDALRHHWPRLVFLSGCSTGQAADTGLLASMAEALVKAGAPTVLGWARPVGDIAATRLAASLYQSLGRGDSIVVAVTEARRAMAGATPPSSAWHLLRLYADRTPLTALVTARGTKGRARLITARAHSLFLDNEGTVKVASRESFVGRRRDIRGLLRQLRPADGSVEVTGTVLHGMGGLGKSSLAARLLERLHPTHPHKAVWVGKIAPSEIPALTTKLTLPIEVTDRLDQLLNRDSLLVNRLMSLLHPDGPLGSTSDGCLFVFDDFEDGNLEPDGQGGFQCTADALAVLTAFAEAIERTDSPSRVLVTSRYSFPLPDRCRLAVVPVGPLEGNDLQKKLRSTRHLGPLGKVDETTRARAIEAAAGIPRLIERLDDVIENDSGALGDLLTKIEAEEEEYRDELLLSALLEAQPSEVRRLLALASVYEIAVPMAGLQGLLPGQDIRSRVDAAVNAGLLQAGLHPATNERRYLVSGLLHPLIEETAERLTENDLRATQKLAAESLYALWMPDAQ